MRYLTQITLFFFGIVIITACGSGSSKNSSPSTTKTLASVSISSGNNQTATVGTELSNPLIAVTRDDVGNPLAGQTVNFKVTTGSGTVFAGAATSDSSGIIRERWTLGTVAGTQTVEVRAIDSNGTAVVYATFTATALAGTPVNISATSQVSTPTQLSSVPIMIAISDIYGNPNIGMSVNLTADNGGTVLPNEVETNSSGQASAAWTVGPTIGTQTLRALVTGADPYEISLDVTRAAAGDPTTIVKASGDLQTVIQHLAAPVPFSVLVTDNLDNPVPNIQVNFSNAIENTPKNVTIITDENGLANLAGYFHASGQQQLDATVQGVGTTTFDVDVTASTHTFDGQYDCLIAPGIFITNGTIVKYPPDTSPQIYGQLRDITFNETDGTISFNQTIHLGYSQTFTGILVVDSLQQASGSGTSIIVQSSGSSPNDDWTCNRR